MNELFRGYINSDMWMAPINGIPVQWFLTSWTLPERKEREKFQAVLYEPPESMTSASLALPNNGQFLDSLKVKMFKEIKTPDRKRKIVLYFESWNKLKDCTNNKQFWDGKEVSWCRHTSSAYYPSKKHNRSKSQSAKAPKKTTNKNKASNNHSGPRAATGANRIPINHSRSGKSSKNESNTKSSHDKSKSNTKFKHKKKGDSSSNAQ
ncbi:hypothetical protein RclHR1_18780003 [Rhizophagus clarus]|uniref:Uncharacterized protein n=1 Tax=Rhizophagus clarus TaxID=94130 RepID=A0A2Z6R3D8_9GLOM|nr:hypothetical protein RclHR1_18780003 [Rhizophagus clarus]GES94476.1 hypothetical protein GLOIN_2v1871772 [Rhizophagus clarus]